MDKFLVRKVKKEDSKKIWEIRNQPISRKYSNNPEEISFEKHTPWFAKKYFSGEDNHCFVLENESGLVIGYCRLDFDDDCDNYIISIALDANFHGKGLGNCFLNEVLQQFHGKKNIFAEIQKGNVFSIKLFQNNNFKIYKGDKKNYYLKYLKKENNSMNSNDKFQVYGKYSLGSGSVLSDPGRLYFDIDDPAVIESYKNSITKDLAKAGIPLENLKNYEVLDVGTGRQAIAFFQLGAKRVRHYDISRENVKKMELFIKKNSLEEKISTQCVDLVEYQPPQNNFDLVFLHGIVQHFSDTGQGLRHCLNAVKPNGYISLYFYRSGTFFNFVVDLIRDLISQIGNLKEYFVNSILLFSEKGQPNHFVSDIMDSFFDPYIHLYAPDSYLAFVLAHGFEIISSSKLDPHGKKVDHTFAHPSVVITCRKTKDKNLDADSLNILAPKKSINQLDKDNYSPHDTEILKTINEYNLLKETISSKNLPRSLIMCLAFKIYRFLQDLDHSLDRKITLGEGDENHKCLQTIISNSRELIEKEF